MSIRVQVIETVNTYFIFLQGYQDIDSVGIRYPDWVTMSIDTLGQLPGT